MIKKDTPHKTLDKLPLKKTAVIKACSVPRFQSLGVIEGTKITALFSAPFRDPTAYLLRGTVIALRKKDCMEIEIV